MNNIHELVSQEFQAHPFAGISEHADYKVILANFLAMSQAFPYLQAGSQKELIFHYMNNDADVPPSVEKTSVVGNFLCWDETGGLYSTIASGLKALPRILETHRFHANLLRKDCVKLFAEALMPSYSAITKAYLTDLYQGLSSLDVLERIAYMVGFEVHADNMISALWESLIKKFGVSAKKLLYFMIHVGEDDPAEAYHVEMTRRLMEEFVKPQVVNEFKMLFNQAYARNYRWCADVISLGLRQENAYDLCQNQNQQTITA